MSFSDLKMFVRNLLRNKLYSGITLFGFATALTFVIILSMYIRQEMSVDDFHTGGDRIFRLVTDEGSYFSPVDGEVLKESVPGIETYMRLGLWQETVTLPDKQKIILDGLLADASFFTMFSFKLTEGNVAELFRTRQEVVLSRSFARRLFGEEQAVGKILNCRGKALRITGIMEDMPGNTHFCHADAIFNMEAFPVLCDEEDILAASGNWACGLYIQAAGNGDISSRQPEMLAKLKQEDPFFREGEHKELRLEPLRKVYFGGAEGEGTRSNDKKRVSVLAAIALVILVLALVNYINLSLAQAGFRAKETAIRKLLGSNNRKLICQFITEAVLVCLFAFALACFFAVTLIPVFNELLQTHILWSSFLTPVNILFAVLLVLLLGIVAGALPALMIVRFNPVAVVKGVFRQRSKGIYGKVLICFQYTVTIILLACTLVIVRQNEYIRNYDLGFDKENIIYLSGGHVAGRQTKALKSELEKLPGVVAVSCVWGSPLDGGGMQVFEREGKKESIRIFEVDSSFFSMLRLRVMPTGGAVARAGIWLNETAVKKYSLDSCPSEFQCGWEVYPVQGIVNDFHYWDLKKKIEPAMLSLIDAERNPRSILVKISGLHPLDIYGQVKKSYGTFIGGEPFYSGFMDERIHSWYEEEMRTAGLLGYFSALAVVLSVMGLLGMATYFIQQRVKEIGIRRVNGATIGEVWRMLVNGFMKWVVLAFIIATPIAFFAMDEWLKGFAYKTGLSWWLFLLAGIFALLVAALMVGWQSIRVAMTNPVKSLQSE